MYQGIGINWTMGQGPANIKTQPLYIKYNTQFIGDIVSSELKTDIKGCLYTTETQYVVAYLCNLLRVVALVA